MSTASRLVAASATDAACRILGRRSVVRAAHYVLLRARFDHPNEMTANGESALQRWVIDLAPGGPVHVADVGANVGHWSLSMLAAASAANRADEPLRRFAANMDKCRDIGEPDGWS